jgi:hypothetical protein
LSKLTKHLYMERRLPMPEVTYLHLHEWELLVCLACA